MNYRIIPCKDLLKYCFESPSNRIVFIQGQSGAGKSTLLREIQIDILQNIGKPRKFSGSEEFQIPFLFTCRTLSCRTLSKLVSSTFPCAASKLVVDDLIRDAIGQMKCLFLIDGLDEINDDSKALVEGEILVFLKNHVDAICILTSRPHSVKSFKNKLKEEGFCYQTLNIEEINSKEEQKEFLTICSEKGQEISSAYDHSVLSLHSPVHLALYSFSYSSDPDSVKHWSTSGHLMQGIIDYGFHDASKRLHHAGVRDPELICESILKWICFISFSCLLKNKVALDQIDIELLVEKTREECRGYKVSTLDILSCFFPSVGISNFGNSTNEIEFFHKSHQEVLASSHFSNQMIKARKSCDKICLNAINKYNEINGLEDDETFNIGAFIKRLLFTLLINKQSSNLHYLILTCNF